VTLEIAPDVYVRFVKQAIGRVLPPEDEESAEDTADAVVDEAVPAKDEAEDKVEDTPKLPPTHTEK
jgi:preprotein translocase subunit YajC